MALSLILVLDSGVSEALPTDETRRVFARLRAQKPRVANWCFQIGKSLRP